eukprot:TRINITY_DN6777_c0_g1_i1.p1 TRINITY_DN6777_c0_g1~~TRINITY_DN6777_c0_g1_i1.p1  ORF type:complete len:700 (+),score=233.72 TRINITY_DN6777_c0_g1_i1:73-2172(+)
MADQEQVDRALLAWIKLFPNTEAVSGLADLSNGVILAAVLSEMHERYRIRDSELSKKDNWVLQTDNLNLVVRNLNTIYRKFGPDTVNLSDVISSTKIAEEQDLDEIRALCKFMLTSMFASPKADELGNAIMPLQEEEETRAVPELLMSMMQSVQEEYSLDPSTVVGDDDMSPPSPSPEPPRTYDDKVFQDDRKVSNVSAVQTAADFEEQIQELQQQLLLKNDEIMNLQEINNKNREDRSIMEDKYQALYDKQFSERSISPAERAEDKPTKVPEKLKAELTSKDNRIAELEKRVEAFNDQEEEWIRTADELQIAQHDLAEMRNELDKVESIREQRDRYSNERTFYKNNMEAGEQKLEEEVQRSTKLQSQVDRLEQKMKKLDEINAEKLLLEVKLTDTENKLADAQQQLNPLKSELASAQRTSRQNASELTSLKEELEMYKDKQQEDGGSSLAEAMGRDDYHKVKKELLEVRGELADKTDEKNTCDKTIDDQRTQLSLQEKQLSELKEAISNLEKEKDKHAAQLSSLAAAESKIERLEKELNLKNVAETEIDALKEELRVAKQAREASEAALRNETKIQTAKVVASAAPVEKSSNEEDKDKEIKRLKAEIKTLRLNMEEQAKAAPSLSSQDYDKRQRDFKERFEQAKIDSQKELKKINSAFYQLGQSALQQQVNFFSKSQTPQSWLAKKKHEAHSFPKVAP